VQFEGRDLNARALWQALGVDIPEHDDGEWSSLLFCPAHENTRTPAFGVNLRYPRAHCFNSACQLHEPTDYVRAVSIIRGCTAKEARRFILGFTRASMGVEVEPERRRRKTLAADSPLALDQQKLERGDFRWLPRHAREYLDSRGIGQAARGKWQVGWDEERSRIVIPAFDGRGALRFLIRRAIDDRRPKYLYTDGVAKENVFFGLDRFDRERAAQEGGILVEGSIDVIVLHEHDLPCTLATLGSGLSERQVRIADTLDVPRWYLMFDRDSAGVYNVLDARKKLAKTPLFVCRYKDANDPAETKAAQAQAMVRRATPIGEFARKVNKTRATKKEAV